jgi:hypothetical protein
MILLKQRKSGINLQDVDIYMRPESFWIGEECEIESRKSVYKKAD